MKRYKVGDETCWWNTEDLRFVRHRIVRIKEGRCYDRGGDFMFPNDLRKTCRLEITLLSMKNN